MTINGIPTSRSAIKRLHNSLVNLEANVVNSRVPAFQRLHVFNGSLAFALVKASQSVALAAIVGALSLRVLKGDDGGSQTPNSVLD